MTGLSRNRIADGRLGVGRKGKQNEVNMDAFRSIVREHNPYRPEIKDSSQEVLYKRSKLRRDSQLHELEEVRPTYP